MCFSNYQACLLQKRRLFDPVAMAIIIQGALVFMQLNMSRFKIFDFPSSFYGVVNFTTD